MGDASTNGTMVQSATIDHIYSYPLIHDSVEAFKENPYGQKSINLSSAAFDRFVKPALPLLETPASYAKPYALKIDEFGNFFLDKVDERVPMLKSETKDVKDTVIAYVHWPLEKAGETKQYVFNIYNEEYKKCGGDGVVAGSKALITSSLVLTSETLSWLSQYLSSKKKEGEEYAKDISDKFSKQAKEFTDNASKKGSEFYNEATKKGSEAYNEASKKGSEAYNEASKKGSEAYNEASKYANEASKKGHEYANEASKKGSEAYNEASKQGHSFANETSKKGQHVAHEASKKTKEASKKAEDATS